ncbi:MAG: ATP-dependent helicase C-terminal domain-containing protein, partial [Chthoniobacteraceae bacterium]
LPEVRRLDLAEVVLTLKASGVRDVGAFRWLEKPDPKSLAQAETLLADLGAINSDGAITALGQRMLAFPAHPRYARMLLAADEQGCVPAVALVAALTQGRGILQRAQGKDVQQKRDDVLGEQAESDFSMLIRAFDHARKHNFAPGPCRDAGIHGLAAREAAALTDQFLKIARDEKLDTRSDAVEDEAIAKCVLAGFPDHVAMRLDQGTLRCAVVHGRKGVLARESAVHHAPLLVAAEMREVNVRGDVQTLLTLATAIREEWLRELFPDSFSDGTEVTLDPFQKRVVAKRTTRFRDLILRSKETDAAPDSAAAALLAEQVINGTCPLKLWDHAVDQWIVRLNFLAAQFPEWQLPPLPDEDRRTLIEQICLGAVSFRQIADRAVWPTVKSWLSPTQQQLIDDYAPERLELPNGRRAKITYAENQPPTLGARIQDLYGVTGDLRIAGGKVPLVIQVLAPNHRPIQITSNLANFWKESYPKIKQELSRKYPKHEWR